MFLPAPWWLRPQTARDVALGAAAAAVLMAVLLPTPLVMSVMAEHGPVEMTTVAFYLVAAALLMLLRPRTMDTSCSIMLSLVLLAFAARELDLHNAFTGTSVLKVSFYTGQAPLVQKVAAAAIVVPVAGLMVALARRAGHLLQRARRAEPAAMTVVTFLITLVVSKVADRAVNVLAEYSVDVSPLVAATILSVEEVLELSLPLLASLAWLQAYPTGSRAATTETTGKRSADDGRQPCRLPG